MSRGCEGIAHDNASGLFFDLGDDRIKYATLDETSCTRHAGLT